MVARRWRKCTNGRREEKSTSPPSQASEPKPSGKGFGIPRALHAGQPPLTKGRQETVINYNVITKCTTKLPKPVIFICIFPSCTKRRLTYIIDIVVRYTEACSQNRRERSGFGFERRSNGMDELSSCLMEANDMKFASTRSWYTRWCVYEYRQFLQGKRHKNRLLCAKL